MSLINLLHSLVNRVEKGWDPIHSELAHVYNEIAANDFAANGGDVLSRLAAHMGGFQGKRILDLGAGPGYWSVSMALKGGCVTWHDPSRRFLSIAEERAHRAGVPVKFSLGYLENAKRAYPEPFDLVFCRLCWDYGRGDRTMGRLIYNLVRPEGGFGYIECSTPALAKPTGLRKCQSMLNEYLWWKVGHPYPPHNRVANVIMAYSVKRMELDYRSSLRDVVLFQR